MLSKTVTKKKDAAKQAQLARLDDDEIREELEAMTNLEYNLHSEVDCFEVPVPETPLFAVKKNRHSTKETSKHENRGSTKEKVQNVVENESHVQSIATRINHVAQPSKEELSSIIRQQATTSEEKYRILEARDRLMRARQVKSRQRPSMSKATRGICPDMCPEKERLMRESQRQVAAYELLEGAPEYRIDHAAAVKQYSRSSADQEEPLPQDLRPVGSLKMTMSYLLHEIADLCELNGTNLAEWYHFLWDRTRGIRKDITQQELCCLDSVELVEQCARFHIICAERLCAEEASVFDKKINTENLTKCLQSLKYMYQDLREKGIVCKNEPEFRAYIILLNLNNGNFMWDVQRLPSSIQKSPEVKFAITAYSSIQSNNYAKFFRLVRETTYPNACILLRYFDQVRTKAISIMVKAYCRTTSTTAFPLYEMIDILGFDDENEAVSFCEQLGLNLSSDELHVILNRRNLTQSVASLDQGRARNLVEIKRLSAGNSIGLCIAGNRMPEKLYEEHEPHDSFDSQGYLKPESLNAEDQNVDKSPTEEESDQEEYEMDQDEDVCEQMTEEAPEREQASPPATANDNKIDFGKANASNSLFQSTNSPSIFQMSTPATEGFTPFVPKEKPADSSENKVSESFTKNSFSDGAKNVENVAKNTQVWKPIPALEKSQTQCEDSSTRSSSWKFNNISPRVPNIFAKFAEPKSESPLGNAAMNIFSKPIVVSSSSEVVSPKVAPKSPQDSKLKPKDEFPAEKVETLLQRIDREAKDLCEELEQQMTNEFCTEIIREEIDRARFREEQSEEILSEILSECIDENCREILTQEIFVDRKLAELAKRMRHRLLLKYCRIWRELTRRKRHQRGALDETPVWLQKRTLDECARSLYRRDQRLAIETMRRKRLKRNEDDGRDQALEYLEPLESKIYEGVRENARIQENQLSPDIYWKMIVSWPCLKDLSILSRYKRIIDEYISTRNTNDAPIVKSYRVNSYETLHMCIDTLEGPVDDDSRISGSDGIFFLAASSESPGQLLLRLKSTIWLRQKLMPVPVFVSLFAQNSSIQTPAIKAELERCVEDGRVSEFTIRHEEVLDENVVLSLTQEAAHWLAVNKPSAVPLEMDYLIGVIDSCLAEELWLRIIGDSSFNEHLRTALSDIRFVIDLHNEAVAHLLDILFDPESLEYTDFPLELKMFVPEDTQLPCTYEKFDDTWRKEENRTRLKKIVPSLMLPRWMFDWPIEDSVTLEKCLAQYCEAALQKLTSSNLLLKSTRRGQPNYVQFLLEMLKEKMRNLNFSDTVVYNKNHIRHFRNSPWWFKSSTLKTYYEEASRRQLENFVPHANLRFRQTTPSVESESTQIREIDEVVQRYGDLYRRSTSPVISRRQGVRDQVHRLFESSESLEHRLLQHESQSKLLDQKLSQALAESDNDIF